MKCFEYSSRNLSSIYLCLICMELIIQCFEMDWNQLQIKEKFWIQYFRRQIMTSLIYIFLIKVVSIFIIDTNLIWTWYVMTNISIDCIICKLKVYNWRHDMSLCFMSLWWVLLRWMSWRHVITALQKPVYFCRNWDFC